MLLLPLYLQVVRGESRDGHRPAAGPAGLRRDDRDADRGPAHRQDRRRPDRAGRPGRSSRSRSSRSPSSQADTSYWAFGVVLFVMGLGMGATMMPTFSGAMQTLRQAQIARASTTLNINQQVGASIGTAVLSVLLANALTVAARARTAAGSAPRRPCRRTSAPLIAEKMAEAFGSTYWWALALVVLAFAIATPLLPEGQAAAGRGAGRRRGGERPAGARPRALAAVLRHARAARTPRGSRRSTAARS